MISPTARYARVCLSSGGVAVSVSYDLSSEKNFTVGYKASVPSGAYFGRIWTASMLGRDRSQGLGEFRAGKPANSPVGAISRRRGYLIRPTPFFIGTHYQPRSLQGGVEPSRHKVGASGFVAPGPSACEMLLPATHPDAKHAATIKPMTLLTIPP